jgi:hypothetical protein
VEALFCWYAFEGESRTLAELRRLLQGGARSESWDLTPVVAKAIEIGHTQTDFIRVLGEVVMGMRQTEDLAQFPWWAELGK